MSSCDHMILILGSPQTAVDAEIDAQVTTTMPVYIDNATIRYNCLTF